MKENSTFVIRAIGDSIFAIILKKSLSIANTEN